MSEEFTLLYSDWPQKLMNAFQIIVTVVMYFSSENIIIWHNAYLLLTRRSTDLRRPTMILRDCLCQSQLFFSLLHFCSCINVFFWVEYCQLFRLLVRRRLWSVIFIFWPQSAVMSQYVVRLSVCLSIRQFVTFRYVFHTRWNTYNSTAE